MTITIFKVVDAPVGQYDSGKSIPLICFVPTVQSRILHSHNVGTSVDLISGTNNVGNTRVSGGNDEQRLGS